MGPLTLPDITVLIADPSVYCRRVLRDMMAQSGIKRVFEANDRDGVVNAVAVGRCGADGERAGTQGHRGAAT